MRITNAMLVNTFISNMNNNMNKMSVLQYQMGGKKNQHISDDPVALIYSQQAKYKLRRLADYSQNVNLAKSWIVQAEAGSMELNKVLASAYESCIDAATDVKTETDFANVAKYVGQLRDHVLDTLNTTIGDKFVFAGYNTTGYETGGKRVPPFTVDAATGHLMYNGVDLKDADPAVLAQVDAMRKDVMTYDVAYGTEMPVTVNGIDLAFYGKDPVTGENLNIYNLLSDMYTALTTRQNLNPDYDPMDPESEEYLPINADDINVFISDLQKAQNHVLAQTAEFGGRNIRLEILESRYKQDELNYTQMRSDAEDSDLAEVIMRLSMAETVYNSSLAAGARIIQPTLMDFLK